MRLYPPVRLSIVNFLNTFHDFLSVTQEIHFDKGRVAVIITTGVFIQTFSVGSVVNLQSSDVHNVGFQADAKKII